jgi:hypothetical protein
MLCSDIFKRESQIERKAKTIWLKFEVEVEFIERIQFVSILNSIQMKSMKVIDNKQNMMIQEFQHHGESQSSEVMNPQMQMIQFGSNLT